MGRGTDRRDLEETCRDRVSQSEKLQAAMYKESETLFPPFFASYKNKQAYVCI